MPQHPRAHYHVLAMAPASFVFILLVILCILTLGNLQPPGKRQILVFGGNGFIGAATVRHLLDHDFTVTIVNRGNWYWDSAQTVKPYVEHISCDRYVDDFLAACPELVEFINEVDHFDAVVDFSAYTGAAVENALLVLEGKADLYIYISSDSVYEVCERKHHGESRESDADRPDDLLFRALLETGDSYGHGKLEAEEVLQRHRYSGAGPAYISLRLPDVIGPRDTLHRLWRYMLWMRVSAQLSKPLPLPAIYLNREMSLVYSDDVAALIASILTSEDLKGNVTLRDKAYNLAFNERISLYRLLEMTRVKLGLDDVRYTVDQSNAYYFFPSVNLGPVDTSLAVNELNWRPTPLQQAVEETVNFFETVMKKSEENEAFRANRERVLYRLKQGPFSGQEAILERTLQRIYNSVTRDEF